MCKGVKDPEILLKTTYSNKIILNPIDTILKLYDGQGIIYYLNGNKKYEGEFKNELYSGEGVSFYDNESIEYIGFFLNGKKHGNGQLFSVIGDIIWTGEFIYDQPNM